MTTHVVQPSVAERRLWCFPTLGFLRCLLTGRRESARSNPVLYSYRRIEAEPLRRKCGAERGSHPVVSEVVLLRQLLEQREDLEVVEDVNALHVAEAVVQDSSKLCGVETEIEFITKKKKKKIAWCKIITCADLYLFKTCIINIFKHFTFVFA